MTDPHVMFQFYIRFHALEEEILLLKVYQAVTFID